MNRKNHVKLDEYYQLIRENKQLDIGKMKDEAEELLRYAYQIDDTYGQAFAFMHLAIYYITLRKFDSACFNLTKAKKRCKRGGYDELLLSCFCYDGAICQLSGDKIKAIRMYGKAMELAEKLKEDAVIGVLYNNVASILMDYNDMEYAREYFTLAADKLLQHPGQNNNLVQVYANLVHVCCVLQDLPGAHEYFGQASGIECIHEKASAALTSSEVRLFTEERDIPRVEQAYAEFLQIIDHCNASETYFASDILVVAESLLLADLKENCRSLLMRFEALLECTEDVELKLKWCKLYLRFQETYEEQSAELYEKYYHLLMQSEEQEYNSLAESLRGRIRLSDMNRNQSILEKENETLQKKAHLDEMTGVFNRRYFDKLLLKLNADIHIESIGCIMIDIDHFKEYNDTYGHLQGDQILKKVAALLTKHAAEGISVGRFGGDEFYCLCADLQDIEMEHYLTGVYDELHKQHIEHCKNKGKIITLSAGYCNGSKTDLILSKVLDCADQALYAAKKKGRNGFVKYTES